MDKKKPVKKSQTGIKTRKDHSKAQCYDVVVPSTLGELALFLKDIDPSAPDAQRLCVLPEPLMKIHSACRDEMVAALLGAAIENLSGIVGPDPVSDPAVPFGVFLRLVESAQNYCEIKSIEISPEDGTAVRKTRRDMPEISFDFDPSAVDREILVEFFNECSENIQTAEEALLALENSPNDPDEINAVFRAFHTIKGSSGMLGMSFISGLAHLAESMLSKIRDREFEYTTWHADLALRAIDFVKAMLCSIRQDVISKPQGFDELLELLHDAASGQSALHSAGAPRLGDILVMGDKISREKIEEIDEKRGDDSIGMACVKSSAVTITDVAHALRVQRTISDEEEATIRVRLSRVDRLINMVGELVIAQSMVHQDEVVKSGTNYGFSKKVMQAGKIVRELQDLSLTMRMVQFKATFQKMARIVRDLSAKNGKQIDFIALGKDTEVDRNLVELINDALMHMIRNSIDHGIEPPDVRLKAGKPARGTITLSAYHMSGNVIIEVEDDGKGLDRSRIVAKAIDGGLIKSDDGMSDNEVFGMIFLPGFSTADQVTDLSGRGVGMDVVKKSIESLHGKIEIRSVPGFGCTFRIKIPLTMAITDGMLISAGNHRYIIPTINIQMTFRPSGDEVRTVSGRGEMVMIRKKMLPIVRLHRLFGIKNAVEEPEKGLLVVVEDGVWHYALLVDDLIGQQQVVAKSLRGRVGSVKGISGGAILGDGRVGLILDTAAIMNLARSAAKNSRKDWQYGS